MNLKISKVKKYWGEYSMQVDYTQMDQSIIHEFQGTHPKIVKNWLPKIAGVYQSDPAYKLTKKQKNHHLKMRFEKLFGVDLSKKHFKLV